MSLPFVDLALQYQALRPELEPAIQAVLERGTFILGPEHEAFEQDFARYLGVRHCLGVATGSDALELGLRALGLGPGDEVITAPNTFIATTEAISHVGAAIRWVDVDPRTYNLDPARLEAAVTPRTRALLPVHLYGQPVDMDAIMAIARRYDLKVIEDCAQAHGARWRGRRVGTFGDLACFSFYPSKNLGAYGDGGALVTNDNDLARRVALLRNHGQQTKYVHQIEGWSHRLDNLQAAVLGVKLRHLDDWNDCRRQAAAAYDLRLGELPEVVTPYVLPEAEPVFHLYVIQVPNRDRVRQTLASQGIATGIHYPVPLHQQPAYAHLGHAPSDFPIAAGLGPNILSLPMFPEITTEQIETVVTALRAALRSTESV